MSRISRGFENVGGGGGGGGCAFLASKLGFTLIQAPGTSIFIAASPGVWWVTGMIIKGVNISGVNIWPEVSLESAAPGAQDLIQAATLHNLGDDTFIYIENAGNQHVRCLLAGYGISLYIHTGADAPHFDVDLYVTGVKT